MVKVDKCDKCVKCDNCYKCIVTCHVTLELVVRVDKLDNCCHMSLKLVERFDKCDNCYKCYVTCHVSLQLVGRVDGDFTHLAPDQGAALRNRS